MRIESAPSSKSTEAGFEVRPAPHLPPADLLYRPLNRVRSQHATLMRYLFQSKKRHFTASSRFNALPRLRYVLITLSTLLSSRDASKRAASRASRSARFWSA